MKSIYDARYRLLVDQLIALRGAKDVTQTQLAEQLGKPQSYVAKVENLDRRLDVVELVDWLTALKTPASQFMTELPWWSVP